MKRLHHLVIPFILVFALAAGCYGHSPSESDQRDSISLSSVTPNSGARLTPGVPATFTAVVNYDLRSSSVLAGDRGTITMDIEDQRGNDLDTAVRKTIEHGQGSASLSDHLVVPASGVSQIRVVLTLTPDAVFGSQESLVAATYPVSR
jgi:hypothetical protein